MTTFSKAARAAILLIGATSIVLPVAASAQSKKEAAAAAAAAAPKLSPEFRKAALPVQTALAAKDYATTEAMLPAAVAAAKTDDDRYFADVFRLQLASGKLTVQAAGDPRAFAAGQTALIAPLDALIANPITAKDEVGRFSNIRGKIEYDQKRYAQASAFFERARASGFVESELGLNIVRSKLEGGDITGGVAALRAEIATEAAAGRKAPETWYGYAVSKLNAAKMRPEMIEWMQMEIKAYPTAKNWRNAIIIYGFEGATAAALDKRQKVDLFRLLRVNKALADQNDYAEYAQDLSDIGLPEEAKAVIEEGRALGKIPATSANNNMLFAEANKAIQAEGPLAGLEKKAAAAASGALASATGDAYFGVGNYAKAIELYRMSLSKGSSKPDEVNTHLGMAAALMGDKEAARNAFGLVKTSPRTEIVKFWMLWVDQVPGA